jgi:formylglycine-generating enzyme required for sulfatase activity
MMTMVFALLFVLTLAVSSPAQEAHFFRIAGPVPTTITALGADGYVTWTNVETNATFTVQTATSLLSESKWVDYVQVPATNGVTTERLYDLNPPSGMALIPAGSFTMGDTLDGDSIAIPTNVYVSAFYMDVNLVSSNQWAAVYAYAASHGYSFDFPGAEAKAANHPVESVDWYDCVKWCNARSQQAGLVPVYYTDAGLTQVYTNGNTHTPHPDAVYPNWAAKGYRLPTEAEWEKAARGGLSGLRFPWGNLISETDANYSGCTRCSWSYDLGPNGYNSIGHIGAQPYTTPVGYFPPNGYGLYDMAGNLEEWCWDWYGTPYGQPTTNNPTGPASGYVRMLRGGTWYVWANYCRSANRDNGNGDASAGSPDIGFRSVLPSGQ